MKKKIIKKKLEDFLKDESGNISKDKILKIGLGTISALGILSAFSANLVAGHTNHSSHMNQLGLTSSPPGYPTCTKVDHSSHYSHVSHGSY